MTDPWDRIREQSDGYRYDSFYCEVSGRYGRPDLYQGERQPSDGWLERARAAMSFGSDTRFRRSVERFEHLIR
jgi:hypothetical protein